MLRLALPSEPRFEIDARELAPGASGYTVDTLRELRLELGADTPLWLLMGADQYAQARLLASPAGREASSPASRSSPGRASS